MGYRAKGGVYFIFKQIVGRTQINDKKTIDILTHFSRKYNYPELIKKIKEYGRNNV